MPRFAIAHNLTSAEILAIATRMPDRQQRLVTVTAAYTGMRLCEVLALSRKDVDMTGGTFAVNPETATVCEGPGGRVELAGQRRSLNHPGAGQFE